MTDTTKPVEPVAAAKEALLEAADKFFIAKFYIRDEKMLKCCDDKIAEMKTAATSLDAANAEIERLKQVIQNLHTVEKSNRETANREYRRANKAEAESAALVAAAYEAAVEACADYPRSAPNEDEWTRYDEQIEHSKRCIRALAKDDATAALEAYGATKVREGWEAGMKEAAQISRNHGFMMDIDWWIKTTKKEVSVFSCNSVAESILAAIKEKQP